MKTSLEGSLLVATSLRVTQSPGSGPQTYEGMLTSMSMSTPLWTRA